MGLSFMDAKLSESEAMVKEGTIIVAEFQYRYEGWVQLVSRKPSARIDLSALAEELNAEERGGGKWKFDGVSVITPRLYLDGALETSIPAEVVRQRIEQHLKNGPPAFDPYD